MTTELPGVPASRVGPYRIERRLGTGGMGVVYLGVDERTDTVSAVKLLKPEYVADPLYRDRLRQEVRAAQRVPRFCTARVLGADLDADPPWVATEYIEAPSLDVVLLEQGRLPRDELELFAVGVAVALREIHRYGVVHRDLKPSNILLTPHGPRVIDFGIARVEGSDTGPGQLTPTGAVVGTPRYMAPEQLRGGPVTAAVDVFAWAGLVTFAATGQPPFGGEDVAAAILSAWPELGDLAQPLRGLVEAAFDKDPATRPSASALVDRLSDISTAVTTRVLANAGGAPDTDPAVAPDRPRSPSAGRWSRRRVLAVAAVAAGGVAITTAVTTARWLAGPASGQLGEVLEGHADAIDAVAVGELDGEPIAVSASRFDHTVRVWHLSSGDQIEQLTAGPGHDFRSVAVARRDGAPVAVIGGGGAPSMQVWDLSSGETVAVPFTDQAGVYQAGVSSVAVGEWDGAPVVVSGGLDRTLRVWDLRTGDQLGDPYRGDTQRPGVTFELAVAAGELDGGPIVVAGGQIEPPWVTVWDPSSGSQLSELTAGRRVSSVAVGEVDGQPVVVSGGYDDNTVRVWQPATGRLVGPELTGHSRPVRSVAVGEVDGQPVVVSGGEDQTLRVWSPTSGEQIGPELTGHTGTVTSVALRELDGATVAVSSGGWNDTTVRIWRLPSPGA